ncbi:holo-[acyl-carrier-protein] synthase [Puniceicoccales bacterium CK1056]|uniref:Holo-[acyl-carrier-protein] synthase n=1 Tax=Oceanipulchritudo coccoides TaxID=2706888 RepID=A0A6B2M4C3_9BACT|nr:holo-ACP synthase [Oceanipulchritudo coccoides]NDV62490.1 holo-[acyl-carrier-protein] synthase [Oceanipulchritudo coccoides]
MNISLPDGGIVRSVGTDLIECTRIQRVLERQKERFLERVYTEGERDYCMKMKNPVPHLAARFAAKEAVSKCFTTGIGGSIGWKSIEVIKGEREEPYIKLDEQGLALLSKLGGNEILISLSHTENYGLAVAVLVSD